jgi:Zn finger protein HypA/HybF involved in hydrogenase expression
VPVCHLGGHMGEHQIECNECGWRGMASELERGTDESRGETLTFCPDCGGTDFQNTADKKDEAGNP